MYGPTCSVFQSAMAEVTAAEEEMPNSAFISAVCVQPIILKSDDKCDERTYAFYRGCVWTCGRELQKEHWALFADRFLEKEEAELAVALGCGAECVCRERISPEVRRAVWVRDQGRYARCASRERLEFDHIVPVARGGSNTERNIELLAKRTTVASPIQSHKELNPAQAFGCPGRDQMLGCRPKVLIAPKSTPIQLPLPLPEASLRLFRVATRALL